MKYLLFSNPVTGSSVLKKLNKTIKPEVVITFCNNYDNWKRFIYRLVSKKLTVEDRCRFFYGIPFYDYRILNRSRLNYIINTYDIKLGFIATFSKIIPRDFANLFPKGLYNLHPSLLPKHAGANPFFWIVKDGESYSGTTCHEATEELDGGDIIYQTSYKINGLNSQDLFKRYCGDCRKIIGEMINNPGSLNKSRQPPGEIQFDPKKIPSNEELKNMAGTRAEKKQINKALKLYNRHI